MAIQQNINYPYLPLSGPFGYGNIQIFNKNGSWIVPSGINRVRARMWGAGSGGTSGQGGCGGGFSIVIVENLVGVNSIPVIVGSSNGPNASGNSSSFGNYATATGGLVSQNPGYGYGGYINNMGGVAGATGGGGVASIMGNGGSTVFTIASQGGAGSGATNVTSVSGTNGFLGQGAGAYQSSGGYTPATTGFEAGFSIDFIGMGGGGSAQGGPANGGGGAQGSTTALVVCNGAFPGGGGGANNAGSYGGLGLVIVEW